MMYILLHKKISIINICLFAYFKGEAYRCIKITKEDINVRNNNKEIYLIIKKVLDFFKIKDICIYKILNFDLTIWIDPYLVTYKYEKDYKINKSYKILIDFNKKVS